MKWWQKYGPPNRAKHTALRLRAPKSGNLILDRNKPNRINQVNVTKYLCQGEGHTKLTALHAERDRQNELQGRPARGAGNTHWDEPHFRHTLPLNPKAQ